MRSRSHLPDAFGVIAAQEQIHTAFTCCLPLEYLCPATNICNHLRYFSPLTRHSMHCWSVWLLSIADSMALIHLQASISNHL